ncbi:hypothetical protein PENTCL1PPCAC_26706 [Pristionchus entomophagus]|uniref:Uncharacterized protein n=1 Tax=Pristionchus entomophagus TaxID=358040 RepID=A0AAV5UDB1_9BILA|nr:hypothetical protein PENTCL1PPCAC_26706 [Pristionchus entomophagus]
MILLSFLFISFLISTASSECVRVRGQVDCPTDLHRIEFVRVLLFDRDVLPWEMDDLMGETKTEEDGSFVVEGCGDDLGWWNQPDPYIQIDHRCPEGGHNVAITMRHTVKWLPRTFLPHEITMEEAIRLDLDQVEKTYTAYVPS